MQDIIYCLAGSFTVNIAALDVAVNGLVGDFHIAPLPTIRWLQKNDNCIIQSIALSLPDCFSTGNRIANEPMSIQLSTFGDDGNFYQIAELNAGLGYIGIHTENQEIMLNTFIPFPVFAGVNHLRFIGTVEKMYVSMVNVPAALDGIEFPVFLYMKIFHNLPLIIFP